jgi:hypothetical protein
MFWKIAALAVAAAAGLRAQTVSLQGTVLSVSGEPVAGAVCRLKTLGNIAVTNAQGKYDFSGTTAARRVEGYAMTVAAGDGQLTLRMDRAGSASLDLFGIDGRLIRNLVEAPLSAGAHRFDLALPASGHGLFLLRMRLGSETAWHKLAWQGGFAAVASQGDGGPLAKAEAGDSLYCTHEKFKGGLAGINGRRVSTYAGTQNFRMFSTDSAWKVCAPPITFNFDASAGVARYKAMIPDWVKTEQEVLMEVCQSTFKLPSQAKKYTGYIADIKKSDGVAATGGNHLFFNADYIAQQPDTHAGWLEVVGVQTHEAVHSYQPYYGTAGADGFGEAMPDAVRALNGFFNWPKGAKCSGAFTDAYQDGGRYWYYIEMKHPGFLTSVWQKTSGDIAMRVQQITGESLSGMVTECKTQGMP